MKRRESSSGVNFTSVLIIYKLFEENAIKYAGEIAEYLLKRNYIAKLYVEDLGPFKNIEKNDNALFIYEREKHAKDVSLVITIGGDGTILWANHLFTGFAKPYFLTFNLGTLGYLSYYKCEDYEKVFTELMDSEDRVISFESRVTLDVEFITEDKMLSELTLNCLNDVVFEKGGGTHMIKTDIFFNEEFLTTLRSDGVLISTSTGSTAYNLSAGGSIIHYDADVLILNSMCPFSLSFRPIIFSYGTEIKLILDKSCPFAQVGNDGINSYRIKPTEGVKVKLSPFNLKIIILDKIIGDPIKNWKNKMINQLGWNSEFKNN